MLACEAMGFIVRTIASTLLVGFVVYALFFIRLEERPLGSHLVDVWRSPVMQEKVDLVRRGVKDKLREELAKSAPASHARLHASPGSTMHDDLSEADRRGLAELVGRSAQASP